MDTQKPSVSDDVQRRQRMSLYQLELRRLVATLPPVMQQKTTPEFIKKFARKIKKYFIMLLL